MSNTSYEIYILHVVADGVEITYPFPTKESRENYIKDFILPSQGRGMDISYTSRNVLTNKKELLR